MASSYLATPAGGSADIVYSEMTEDEVDECVQLELEAAWDTSHAKAYLCEEARQERYQEHVKWTFAQDSKCMMLEYRGDWPVFKAVQDGRIVGMMDISKILRWRDRSLDRRIRFLRGPLPMESLQKPIHELGDEDRKKILNWMPDRDLERDYAEAGFSLKDLKGSATPYYGIEQLAVAPDKRGQGIAQGLINHLRQRANREGASILAICRLEQRYIFQKCGFEYVDERPVRCCGERICYWSQASWEED